MKKTKQWFVSCCAMMLALLATSMPLAASAQKEAGGTLRGKVVDETSAPVIGASVVVKSSTKGVSTDVEGAFTISGLKSGDVLEVSYIGYDPQEFVYSGQTFQEVILRGSATEVDAVVVTALGIKRSEKALSYNVQKVNSEEVTTVKDANFMNALAGKIAGVQISSAANGAGGPTRVVMRGVKSLTGSNNALYVINGVPMNNATSGNIDGIARIMDSGQPTTEGIADINPEDIESISVLNGPAAAALYGSSAANGVVLITTKKGVEDAVKVTFSHNTVFSSAMRMPEFQSTYGNDRNVFGSWGAKGTARAYDPADFFKTGSNISNAVTLSIGNNRNQTYFSAAMNNSEAIIPNSDYNRYNFTIRNTTKFLKEKMTLDLGANYIIQDQLNPVAQGGAYNPLWMVYLWPRSEDFKEIRMYQEWSPERNIYVQRWPFGSGSGGNDYTENPYWEMYRKLRSSSKNRYMINASLSYDILDWLNVSGRVRIDNSIDRAENKFAASSIATNVTSETGYYSFMNSEDKSAYADALVNINKSFEKFSVSANIGTSLSHEYTSSYTYGGSLGVLPNVFLFSNIDRNASGFQAAYTQSKEREYAVFANVELGYRNMLFLTLTARNEWSSTLSNTPKMSYFFPSVGLSAVLSEMMKMPKWIDYMKVRASFADVGSPLKRSLTETYYTWNGVSSGVPSYRPVTRLYPEKTDSWEAGLTLRLLKHINIDATWYLSDTKKQTIPIELSVSGGGYSYMYMQTGNIRNQGLELQVGYENQWRDFGYGTSFTYSTNRNRITKLFSSFYDPLSDTTYTPNDINISSGNNTIKVGGTMGDIYTTVDFERDPEGNIYVDPATNMVRCVTTEPRYVGTTLPKGNLGWSNTFSYKGLTLNALFTASLGGSAVSNTQMILDKYGVSKATADARDAGGIRVNDGMVDARGYYDLVAANNMLQNYVYDATTVRLQELSLSYALPRKWFRNKMKMTVSFIGRNLWLVYCKAPFDPGVTASTGTYYQNYDYFMMPSLRNVGFSLNLEF